MTKESEFFIYLLERYAEYKNTNGQEVLKQWNELGLTKFIYDLYELYHIESIYNAFNDIDTLIEEKKKELTNN